MKIKILSKITDGLIGQPMFALLARAQEMGAGEVLLTSMDKDGTENGFDLELTRTVAEKVNIPVIASGGAGGPDHFLDAFLIGKADAALAASIFHRSQYSVGEVKRYLAEKGVPMRLV